MRSRALFMLFVIAVSMLAMGGTSSPEGEYTIVDEDDNVLLVTGWRVYRGDRFISTDDKEYEVMSVRNRKATARFITTLPPIQFTLMQPDEVPQSDRPIVIYHTHTHESFVPTEKTDSIPRQGGIIKVGNVLADELSDQGVAAEHITTAHCPADSRSYNRSRRTVVKAIREHNPIALLDVHRDAAPASAYQERVHGELTAQVLIVVGRYNPNRRVNTRFARQVKSVVDERAPGLIKGIFFASGSYNQDLSPRALLLEMGSHLTSRDRAETGARIFAQAAADVLQPDMIVEPQQEQEVKERQEELERESELSAAGILALVAIGGTVFTIINQPRIRPIIERAARRGQRAAARNYLRLESAAAPTIRRIQKQTVTVRRKLDPSIQKLQKHSAPLRRRLGPGFRWLHKRSVDIDRKVETKLRELRQHSALFNRKLKSGLRTLHKRSADVDRKVERRMRRLTRRLRWALQRHKKRK